MKKSLKIVALSGMVLLFCLLISATTAFTTSGNIASTPKESPENAKLKATDSNVLLCFTSRTKISVAAPEENINPSVKKLSSSLFVHTKTVEKVFNAVFSHYTFCSQNICYRLSQIDRLYPFHHFW